MRRIIILGIFCFICVGCMSLRSEKSTPYVKTAEKRIITMDENLLRVYLKEGDFTGAQLRKLATEKEIIPVNADYEYFQTHKKEQNAAAIWLIYSRKEKIAVIDGYKRIYKLRGTVVSKPSEYYVDRINNVLYRRIRNDQFDIAKNKGIINIFKTIAIFDGDYDDGRKKIVILRQWIGEENFGIFRQNYPALYNKLLKMSQ